MSISYNVSLIIKSVKRAATPNCIDKITSHKNPPKQILVVYLVYLRGIILEFIIAYI